jgi:iron-sulfur cluster repair protein YtfE (RIC family)
MINNFHRLQVTLTAYNGKVACQTGPSLKMKSTRRHDSLIPLSREHHYGLMACLRIHRGLPKHRADLSWLDQRAKKTVLFFDGDLTPHFKAEEEILFPAMRHFPSAADLVTGLISDHRKLQGLVQKLRQVEGLGLAGILEEFADTLENHIRREERELFPLYEQQVTADLAGQIGERITNALGTASHPKHPELLE